MRVNKSLQAFVIKTAHCCILDTGMVLFRLSVCIPSEVAGSGSQMFCMLEGYDSIDVLGICKYGSTFSA